MYCPNCGKLNSDQATFCTGCGTSLKTTPQFPDDDATRRIDHDATVRISRPAHSNNKSPRPVLFAAIGVLTVLLIGAVAFLFINKNDAQPTRPGENGAGVLQVEETQPTPAYAYPADDNNPDSRFQGFDWLSEGKISLADLAGLSAGDLRILRNAIFAMHGYKFKSADLQEYFGRFPWYSPGYSDVSAQLSPIEKANIELIQKHEGKGASGSKSTGKAKLRNVSFANDYSDVVCYVYLDASDLRGLSSTELRLLRNTIYARHGRRFKDAALQNYFNSMYWYNPTCNEVSPSSLSAVEKHNIALIQSFE